MTDASLMEYGRAVARHPKPETYKETVDDLAAAKSLIGRLTDALTAVAAVQQPNREAVAKWLFEFKCADLEGYWDAGHVHEFIKDQYRRKADAVLAALAIPATGEAEWEYGEFNPDELLDDGTIHEWAEPKDVWADPLPDFELADLRRDGGIYARRRKAGPWVEVTR